MGNKSRGDNLKTSTHGGLINVDLHEILLFHEILKPDFLKHIQ